MQAVTDSVKNSIAGSSFIRKMFEKGIELKREFGADAVCDFSLGNPDVPPPSAAYGELIKIAENAVKPLGLGYCPNAGLPVFREALAGMLTEQQKTPVEPKHVIATVGAAGAIVALFRAVVDPGDEILVPAPYFVEYGSYCGHFGGVLKPIPSLLPDFRPDLDAIEKAVTPRTRAIRARQRRARASAVPAVRRTLPRVCVRRCRGAGRPSAYEVFGGPGVVFQDALACWRARWVLPREPGDA